MNKNKAKIIISIIVLIITIIISFNNAYSFFNAKVIKENETETLLSSKKLELIFEDTKEVNVKDILPGDSVTKTFTVRSNADEKLSYNIKYKDITNTFQNDMVYTLICDGKQIVEETPLPVTKSEEYILENIEINPKEEKEYILTIKFLYKEEEQNEQQGSIFKSTVEIDLEKNTEPLIVTNETTKEITNKEIEEQEEIVKEFRIRNAESTETIMYSVNLSEIVNTYEKEELSYTLEKNGEIINTSNIPKAGEFTYITYNQEIETGITDNYKLTITKNLEEIEGKEFSTAIEVEAREVKNSIPTSKIILESKKTNSITVVGSCVDSESGIQKYSFYKDGKLEKEINTTEENYKYTYKELNNKEYELKLVCTNNYGVISEAIINEIPVELKEPVIEKTDEYEQTKIVKVKYSNEVSKYLKITGEVISNVELKECNEDLKCEDILSIGSKLKENVWYETTSDVELTYETNGSIRAKITDTTNTKETEEVEIINIDKTKPEVIIETNGNSTYEKSQSTKVTVSDNLSGISELKYQWTTSETEPEEVSFATEFTSGDILTKSEGTGDYYLWILAKDNAGNKIITKSNVFKLDNTIPSCNWSGESTTYRKTANISVTCQDKESGCSNTTQGKTWNYETTTVTKDLSYMIKDNAGNEIECVKIVNVYVDTTPPTCEIEGNENDYISNDITLKVNGIDEHSGGITYSWDGTNYSSTQTKTITANGTYKAYTKDKLGNTASCSVTVDKIDKTKPEVIIETNGNSTYEKSQSTKVTVSDNLSGISELKYQWTASETEPEEVSFATEFTSGDILTKSEGTGDYYLWILAKDNAENKTLTKSNVFKLDNTIPSCKIEEAPTSWTTSTTLTVSGIDSESGISRYSWDGTNYSSTQTKTITANGTYMAYVKDKAGNIAECSKEVSNIDTTSPIAKIETKTKTSNSITVKGSCSDSESGIKRYEFYIDGEKKATYDITSTSKDYTYEKITSGSHTYKLVCTNKATLTSTISGIETTTNLEIPTYTVASGYAKNKTTTISYKGEGAYLLKITGSVTSDIELIDCGTISNNGEYTCSTTVLPVGSNLEENKWYKASSNPTLTYTSNGTIIAKTADGVNYKQGSSLTIDGVDTTSPSKPTVTLKLNDETGSSYTSGTWTNNNVYVEINATDDNEIDYYEWYDSSWNKITTNNVTYESNIDLPIKVRAIDKAGNISEETSFEIKIDKTKPSCSWSGESTTYRKSATIKVTCNDSESGCEPLSTSKEWNYTTTTKTASLSYTIKDNAGNTNTCNKTANVYVDTTSPTKPIITNSSDENWSNTNVTITLSSTDDHSGLSKYQIKYSGNNNTWSDVIENPQAWSEEINETLYYRAVDKLENISEESITNIKIDKTKPTVTFGTNGNSTYEKSQSTKVTVSDNLSGVNTLKYQWTTSETEPEEESFTTTFTNESTLTKTTSTGDYYLWILAKDNAGNKIITKSNVFKLDNTAPTCNISGNPTSWTTSATLTASGTDTGGSGLSTVVFTGTTSSSKTVTTNGEVSATVTDNAGNTNTCSVTVSKIDTAKPTCSISGVPTSWAKSATLTVSGTDSQSGVASYSWDGTNYSSTKTKSITANGTYTAYVKDNVGRVQSCSVTVSKIDTAAPATPTITNNSSGNWTKNNVVITASSSDSQSGLNRIEYSYNNSTWYTDWDSAMSNNKVTGTWSAERNNTVYIRAVDNVGRVSGNATTTVRIDKTTPSLSIRTGNYEMTSTTGIVSSVSYGASGGSVSCIDKSLSNKSVSNMNNLGYLGKHSISCTAKGNTGNTKTVTGTISIQRTYTGSQLNYGGAAKISGTSLLLTPTTSSDHGHQYGPYVAALAGRYRVWYYGNNLNTFATTDEQAASSNGGNRYFAYYNLGQSWLTIESLNYVSADSNYYITLGSNVTNLEINIVNYSKFWTTTIDKVIISPA